MSLVKIFVEIVSLELVSKADLKIHTHSSHKHKLIICCVYVATCYNISTYETLNTLKLIPK
jgi:hypothetical protein